MGARRKARVCALQMLFQFDVAKPRIDDLVQLYWSSFSDDFDPLGEIDRDFSNNLALGTASHIDDIDRLIKSRAENWRISRMAVVDRNILRLAIYEFLYESETPKTVVINEALEIARKFSTFEATQFINGILDAIKRDLESSQSASAANGHQ